MSRVVCHLDELLAARGMTLVELSEKVGVNTVNLSVLKNDRAKAIRYSTLCAICEALGCSVGELLEALGPPLEDGVAAGHFFTGGSSPVATRQMRDASVRATKVAPAAIPA